MIEQRHNQGWSFQTLRHADSSLRVSFLRPFLFFCDIKSKQKIFPMEQMTVETTGWNGQA